MVRLRTSNLAQACNVKSLSMQDVAAHRGHQVRCERYLNIDWEAAKPKAQTGDGINYGKTILQVKNMQKYYEVHDRNDALGERISLVSKTLSYLVSESHAKVNHDLEIVICVLIMVEVVIHLWIHPVH